MQGGPECESESYHFLHQQPGSTRRDVHCVVSPDPDAAGIIPAVLRLFFVHSLNVMTSKFSDLCKVWVR